jgi:hypothetical protein
MGWIFFQDTPVSPEHLALGLEPSPIVKTTTTASLHLCAKCNGAVLIEPQSGMTCEHCEQSTSELKSTLSPEAGLARATVARELERAWIMSSQSWRSNSFGLFASFDPNSFSLKTSQGYLSQDLMPSSVTLPRMGMWDDTGVYHVVMWDRPGTKENASGDLLPTPVASEAHRGGRNRSVGKNARIRGTLAYMARHGLLPTPTARDWKDGSSPNRHGQYSSSLPLHLSRLGLKGYVNPRFVERLMGLPNGAVKLKPWAAELFLKSQGRRSCA